MLCTVKALLFYCKLENFVNILAGDGFNLFQNFRDTNGKENLQNPRKISTSSTNWFFSIFASNKGKMTTGQGIILCSPVHSTPFANDHFHDRLLFKILLVCIAKEKLSLLLELKIWKSCLMLSIESSNLFHAFNC